MKVICTLEIDNNKCPHYLGEKTCDGTNYKCGFRRNFLKEKYERKERWYEKYYRK